MIEYPRVQVYPTLSTRPSLGDVTPEGRVVAIQTTLLGGGTIERFFVERDSDGRAAWFENATRAIEGTEGTEQ